MQGWQGKGSNKQRRRDTVSLRPHSVAGWSRTSYLPLLRRSSSFWHPARTNGRNDATEGQGVEGKSRTGTDGRMDHYPTADRSLPAGFEPASPAPKAKYPIQAPSTMAVLPSEGSDGSWRLRDEERGDQRAALAGKTNRKSKYAGQAPCRKTVQVGRVVKVWGSIVPIAQAPGGIDLVQHRCEWSQSRPPRPATGAPLCDMPAVL